MKVHFIAIGGSAMHNLAMALHHKGYEVTGSDDQVFDPAKTRLESFGLLPESEGWFPEKIGKYIDAIILGMHAREDNPELIKAQELGLKIFSYPEYLYEQTKDKTRVVIGGSHGKTTITAMILHVLHYHRVDSDYMVGAQLEGFDTMVRLTDAAPIAVFEGDEYLSSPIDRRPKFHLYQPNIALLSGIAWDHINVFPTFENYVEQFSIFVNQLPDDGSLAYCMEDPDLCSVVESSKTGTEMIPYGVPNHQIIDGVTYLIDDEDKVIAELSVFGDHNLMNLNGARILCNKLGVPNEDFYEAISSFSGASKRMEKIGESDTTIVYKDFAHSPSKVKATVAAFKKQFTERVLVACLELHTFSSLNETFLQEYKSSLDAADLPMVYYSPETIAHKKLAPLSSVQVGDAFANEQVQVFTDSSKLFSSIPEKNGQKRVVLLMSSGNFDGVNLEEMAVQLI